MASKASKVSKIEPEPAGEPSFAQLWEQIAPGSRTSQGVYCVYKTPEGGMHISYRLDGTDEDQHLEIPGSMMAVMIAASEGKGPLGMFKAMAQLRFGG